MTTYPVHYHVEPPGAFTRLQLLVRLIAFCALGVLGLSFGTLFVFGFLALPVFASIRLGGRGAERYLEEDGPRVAHVLRWLAAICAWAGLVADRLPSAAPDEIVRLEIETTSHPNARTAAWRVLTGLPSAIVLSFLCAIGGLVWLWAALSVLVRERVGDGAFHYLVGLQRWSLRLLAYQASLVDEYPPFSFADPAAGLPTAKVAPQA
jgi:Domain of unknown function (DUF4389)